MNVAAAEAAAAVAVAATLLPGECWAACVGFAGTFCLSLCALSSLFTPLSSVFCFVLCFCCFWVVALGDSACEALSQSALTSLPPLPACPACLCAHSLSRSLSFSLFAALSRAVAILFKSFGRETLRRVCVVACQAGLAAQQQRCGPTGERSQSVSCQRCRRKDIHVLTGHVAHVESKFNSRISRAFLTSISIVCRKFVKSVN